MDSIKTFLCPPHTLFTKKFPNMNFPGIISTHLQWTQKPKNDPVWLILDIIIIIFIFPLIQSPNRVIFGFLCPFFILFFGKVMTTGRKIRGKSPMMAEASLCILKVNWGLEGTSDIHGIWKLQNSAWHQLNLECRFYLTNNCEFSERVEHSQRLRLTRSEN